MTTVAPNPHSPYATANPEHRHIFAVPAFLPAPEPGGLLPTACEAMAVVSEKVIETRPGAELPDGMCSLCVAVMNGSEPPARPSSECGDCGSATWHGELCALCRQEKHAAWWPTRNEKRVVWVDGDPLMKAIAAAVHAHCETGDGGIVHDDPRNIAAVAASVARSIVLVEAADFVGNDDDCGCGGCDTCVPRKLADGLRGMAAEPPLSPYYSHDACGFHWHGRDGMDIPMRDGQPVCPRCELRRLAAEAQPTEAPVDLAERHERYARTIHDAMEPDLSLVDQEPGCQALFARAAEAAMALADTEAPTTTQPEPVSRQTLVDLVRDFLDPDPCSFDHHGYCQAHAAGFGGEPLSCPHGRARKALAVIDAAGARQDGAQP